MTVKTFFYGLIASFGIPWLIMLAVPTAQLRALDPVHYTENEDGRTDAYKREFTGRVNTGAMIYAQQGCAQCHTMVTRPSYAGSDLYRPGHAGLKLDPVTNEDSRRITNIYDYNGIDHANLGESRFGPDLSNLGARLAKMEAEDEEFDPEMYIYKHLYDPRHDNRKSVCPSSRQLFDECPEHGQRLDATVAMDDGMQMIPNSNGQAIVQYLLSRRNDNPVPYSMQYHKGKKTTEEKANIQKAKDAAKKLKELEAEKEQ